MIRIIYSLLFVFYNKKKPMPGRKIVRSHLTCTRFYRTESSDSPPFARNVPEWLKDRMSNEEILAFSTVMMRENIKVADLEFFTDDHLKSAGIENPFTRAKMLSDIKAHFSSQER